MGKTKAGTVTTRIRWSPRVPPHQIRRLYENDAQGILDEELLNEVGHALYVRCQDMLEIAEALRGHVKCRNRGYLIERRQGRLVKRAGRPELREGGLNEVLKCSRCSWRIVWHDYWKSVQGKRLDEAGIEPVLESFVDKWPLAGAPAARLLLIDRLIHEFHVNLEGELGCPLAVNVIEGNYDQVYELLQRLACGTGSTPALQQSRREWHVKARHLEYQKVELQAIARELGVKGYSRMRKEELIAAIVRDDPNRFEASS
jgi:hypothetical protein